MAIIFSTSTQAADPAVVNVVGGMEVRTAECPSGYVMIGIDGSIAPAATFDSMINPTMVTYGGFTGAAIPIYCAKNCTSNVYVNSNPNGYKLISSNKTFIGNTISFYGNTITDSYQLPANGKCPSSSYRVGMSYDNMSNKYPWCLPR